MQLKTVCCYMTYDLSLTRFFFVFIRIDSSPLLYFPISFIGSFVFSYFYNFTFICYTTVLKHSDFTEVISGSYMFPPSVMLIISIFNTTFGFIVFISGGTDLWVPDHTFFFFSLSYFFSIYISIVSFYHFSLQQISTTYSLPRYAGSLISSFS